MSGPAKNTMMGAVIHCDRRSVTASPGEEGSKKALFPALELKRDLPLPDPSEVRSAIGDEAYEALVNCGEGGEAGGELRLIKVLRAGICGTDIHMLKGYVDDAVAVDGKSPLILGHEFVGVDSKTHERVVAGINIPCGRCPLCKRATEEGGEDLLSIGGGREEAFTNEEASSLCTSTVKSPQESDGEESRPLRAASSLLSGYHLYQVVVHPAITCETPEVCSVNSRNAGSVVMKDPIKVGASSSVAMAICSACPEGQHQERCEHIALAVDTVARHSFKRSPVDKLAPAKTENIARRLVFTEPITELKGQLQPGEDMQRSLVVIEDGDTRDHQGARDDCPSSSLKRRRAIPHSSADLSSVALTAAVKQRRSQCENVIEGVDDERRASGGGGQAMPGSYRALLQQYL
ncbi:hypothetical protein FOL47_004446 [Perkinsus chesapeaki]|uniref:Alcohol dehydrogenase-like N-terminal domain-containing protein n=1 Tax=Perkinsus chesapeaki TaxID=330153 RepID=A0A7J6M2I6_PERCH|nr:hypothetical protein FOL47_004446 [Perkinsus chesapeaki]